jgi:hypothetical protein
MAGAIGDEMPFKTRAFIARWSQCTRPRLRGTVPPAPPAGQERCWRFALPDAGAGSGASRPPARRDDHARATGAGGGQAVAMRGARLTG